jgi:hypothetical protein
VWEGGGGHTTKNIEKEPAVGSVSAQMLQQVDGQGEDDCGILLRADVVQRLKS